MVYTIIAVHDRNVGTVIPSYPTGKEDMRDESIRRFAPVLLCVTSRERRYLVLHVTNRAAEYNLEIGTFPPGDPDAGKYFYRCTCKGLLHCLQLLTHWNTFFISGSVRYTDNVNFYRNIVILMKPLR